VTVLQDSSRHCGKLIDVRKWSTEDGGIIQQWSDAGGTNQHWKLVLVSSPSLHHHFSQVVKGDVNGDLKVNSTDFSMLRRYLLKIIDNFPTETENRLPI